MTTTKILSYRLKFIDYNSILELFIKDVLKKHQFKQIISVNPENLMLMRANPQFEKLVVSSQTLIPDGIGVALAAKVQSGVVLKRLTGVDLMNRLVRYASEYRLKCLLIGGKGDLADKTAKCYQAKYPKLKIASTMGFLDINKPNKNEENALKQIVAITRPHFVFVAFGSPAQELWIEAHKHWFGSSLVMGIGGALAMNSGTLRRAPRLIQEFGLEWLFRLLQEPWRIKRQLSLIKFMGLLIVLKFKIK